jgi:hypothetical protein
LCGIYKARPAGLERPAHAFAVNLDTTESDLARMDTAELPRRVAVRSTWEAMQPRDLGEIVGRERIHRWLLTAAAGFMLVETLLAWRFSKGGP